MFFTMKLRVNIDESDIASRTHGVHGHVGEVSQPMLPEARIFPSSLPKNMFIYVNF